MRIIRLITILLLLAGFRAYGQLPLPTIPSTLTTPADRAAYLASHFYDAMDWNNTAMTTDENLMQDWANFLSVLPHCTDTARDTIITNTIHRFPADRLPAYADMADGYLFATDSELSDETTYLKVLAALVTHPYIDADYRSALDSRLSYLSRCAPGTTAADIPVEPAGINDTTTNITPLTQLPITHSQLPIPKYILIVFYDPDCEDCHEALATLATDPQWTTPQRDGTLLVVKAEITDDLDNLYPILTVPSLYLLDAPTLTILTRNLPLDSIANKIR